MCDTFHYYCLCNIQGVAWHYIELQTVLPAYLNCQQPVGGGFKHTLSCHSVFVLLYPNVGVGSTEKFRLPGKSKRFSITSGALTEYSV